MESKLGAQYFSEICTYIRKKKEKINYDAISTRAKCSDVAILRRERVVH